MQLEQITKDFCWYNYKKEIAGLRTLKDTRNGKNGGALIRTIEFFPHWHEEYLKEDTW